LLWHCAKAYQNRMHARLPSRRWSRPISALWLVNRSLGASIVAALTRPNAAPWWVVVATTTILAVVILFPSARELFHVGLVSKK
jgi:hypothetical protein